MLKKSILRYSLVSFKKMSISNQMVGKYLAESGLDGNAANPRIYYVPLMFWFCRNPGLSLPLIALQYHEVKIVIEFRTAIECIVSTTTTGARGAANTNTTQIYDSSGVSMQSCALWVDYVYLDTEERRRFNIRA